MRPRNFPAFLKNNRALECCGIQALNCFTVTSRVTKALVSATVEPARAASVKGSKSAHEVVDKMFDLAEDKKTCAKSHTLLTTSWALVGP